MDQKPFVSWERFNAGRMVGFMHGLTTFTLTKDADGAWDLRLLQPYRESEHLVSNPPKHPAAPSTWLGAFPTASIGREAAEEEAMRIDAERRLARMGAPRDPDYGF